jgi:DNA mismatch repair protein MSH6
MDETPPSIKAANTISKRPAPNKKVKNLIGKRVAIYWPTDEEWYNGKVDSYTQETGCHTVTYDDEEVEEVNFGSDGEKWKLIDEEVSKPKKHEASKPKKRKIESSDDDSEADGGEASNNDSEEEYEGGSGSDSASDEEEYPSASDDSDVDEKPQRKRLQKNKKAPAKKVVQAAKRAPPPKKTLPPSKKKAPVSQASKAASPRSTADDDVEMSSAGGAAMVKHDHLKLGWLNEKRKDAKKRDPSDPDFDSRTLDLPMSFLRLQTPAMVTWWEFKAKNFDTVLFFKVGKFYELFHMDADIGVKELQCIYMAGTKAHSGFPETAYGKYAKILVDRGYRVARVEQTETPDINKARVADEKKRGVQKSEIEKKKDKCVRREMCNMMSKGTRTYDHIYREYDVNMSSYDSEESVLLAIKERVLTQSAEHGSIVGGGEFDTPSVEFGVCIVDASTGKFQLGQFTDNDMRERLQTLFSIFPVVEVVYGRGGALSSTSVTTIRHCSPSVIVSAIEDGKEFVDADQTKADLKKYKYFTDPKGEPLEMDEWPALLQEFMQEKDGEKVDLALSSLGGCLWHLRRSLIDHDMASQGQFSR